MSLKISGTGSELILKKFFTAGAVDNTLTLKLFVNAITPDITSVAGNFTEALDGGYADVDLSQANWTVTESNGIATATYPAIQWNFTAGLTTNKTIYGYYIVNSAGALIYAERAAATFTPLNGAFYKVTPTISLTS